MAEAEWKNKSIKWEYWRLFSEQEMQLFKLKLYVEMDWDCTGILVQLAGFSVVNWKCASCGNCMVSPRNGMWLIYQPCESILVQLQRMPCVHASNGFDLLSCALNWKYLPSWTGLKWTRLNWTESVLPIKMCGIWCIKRIKSHWSGAQHN